jgi:hypothetical protein
MKNLFFWGFFLFVIVSINVEVDATCNLGCYLWDRYNDGGNDFATSVPICITYATDTDGKFCPAQTDLGGKCGGTPDDLMRATTESCRCCYNALNRGQNWNGSCKTGTFQKYNTYVKCGYK